MWSRSSTNPGPSTCAASTASPPPTWPCATASYIEEDLSPSKAFQRPEVNIPEAGRVVVTIEYQIDPTQAEAFRALMQESRRSRMRQGALGWSLLHSMSHPERYVEQIIDESW